MGVQRAGRPALPPAGRLLLLPSAPQPLWGWAAVANFVLGGVGAGLYVVAAVPAGFTLAGSRQPVAWLGPLLVLAGLAAVATESGRPLRGIRALARVRTSWMSRELWLGGAFAACAAGALIGDGRGLRAAAAALALALALAQGQILRQARGVPAWAVPPVPLLFLTSALTSGAGGLLLLDAGGGRPVDRLLGGAIVTLLVDLGVWALFVTWPRDDASGHVARPLRDGPAAASIVLAGHFVPALLAGLAVALPPLRPAGAVVVGTLMLGGQACMKAALIRTAGRLRPVTLPSGTRARRSP